MLPYTEYRVLRRHESKRTAWAEGGGGYNGERNDQSM